MNYLHKAKTGAYVLRNKGIMAFLRALKSYLRIGNVISPPNESQIAFEILQDERIKGLMIDVGAHYGGALAPFARCGWQVFAFEPDPENRKRLFASFGNLTNVVIDARAVSDHSQSEAIFYRSDQSTGISGLSAFHHSHKATEKVEVTTLESFFVEWGIEDVDFLKIDTEGYDFFVLKGILWSEVSPRFILCEFEDGKTVPLGYTFHDLAGYLQQRGYKLIISEWYPIKEYGGPHDWKRFSKYPCELEESKSWGNIFAVEEDNLYEALLRVCNLAR